MPIQLDFTKPHVLRTGEEYDQAITEIEELLDQDPPRGTEAYDRLEFLSVLAEAYERQHYPVEEVSPPEVVLFMLQQKGMDRSDLNELLGGKGRVSEFLNGVRPLSLDQVRALRDHLGIPADLLIARADA